MRLLVDIEDARLAGLIQFGSTGVEVRDMPYVTAPTPYSRRILRSRFSFYIIDMRPLASIRLVFLAAALAGVASTALADVYTGRVVAIADGDTLTVLDKAKVQRKVRLSGIDAPEKRQSFGTVSRKHLADLVFGKTVTVAYRKIDRYGRQIGVVRVGEIDANLAQIRAGLAWHYKHYEREQPPDERAAYAAEERNARENKRGLWGDAKPIAPWDFRRHR